MSNVQELREYIREVILESSQPEEHVMMTGEIVPFGCDACISDIQTRIHDASRQRDICPRGSADRASLNGILSMLRRHLRGASRINVQLHGE